MPGRALTPGSGHGICGYAASGSVAGVWFLICVGDPRKGGSRLSSLVLAWSLPRAGWAGGGRCGVKVERPQRSEDERP
jgi:hypothetical protein